MIFIYSKKHGDQICIAIGSKPILVNTDRISRCRVEKCGGVCPYGHNFCRDHQWILPFPAEKLVHGFEVGLIDYWKSQGKKVIATHSYEREKVI